MPSRGTITSRSCRRRRSRRSPTTSSFRDIPSSIVLNGQEGGQIEAIEGTKIYIHARTNMPASRATINLSLRRPGSDGDLPDRRGRVDRRIPRLEVGTYKIDFRTTGGQVNPNPVNFDIIALPDLAPTARFVLPDQPTVKVPANVKGRPDDGRRR